MGGELHAQAAGARFPASVQTCPGAHSASYTMGTGSSPVVKRPGRNVEPPPQSSAEVKERVELFLYSTSRISWPVIAWSLHLPVIFRRFQKLEKAATNLLTSVRPPVRVEKFGNLMKFYIWFFLKIFLQNSSFIKTWQEWRVLYMNTNIHLW